MSIRKSSISLAAALAALVGISSRAHASVAGEGLIQVTGTIGAPVPEPALLAVIGIPSGMVLLRRRRKSV